MAKITIKTAGMQPPSISKYRIFFLTKYKLNVYKTAAQIVDNVICTYI